MSNFSFSNVPVIRHSRSRFDLSHGVKTSANVGDLVPFDVQEVYAGDTFKYNVNAVSRLSSQFIRPVMDNLFLDVYYFYVPSRLLYDKFVNIFGENTESAWANTEEYEVPAFSGTIPEKTVGDYLGLPTKVPLTGVNVLPFRAFAKIYNEWFRDQNNVSPMHVQQGDLTSSETPNNNAWAPNNYFGKLPKVAKLHDYFTSALPAPQKGSSTDIPVSVGGFAEVYPREGTVSPDDPVPAEFYAIGGEIEQNRSLGLIFPSEGSNIGTLGVTGPNSVPTLGLGGVYPSNLYADLSSVPQNAGITVNDLRFAFQYQKMLEGDARGGTRFVEFLQQAFGVSAGDYRLQRSEFLGGKRSPISIHQVTQTTGANSESSPLGEVGAFSLSNSHSRFTKGFVEPGYVIGVFCIRQFHTYQQGVEKFWKRIKRTDFYQPVFANIGEQPIMQTELFAGANSANVFGYNEAWADLRYRPARVSGQMRSNATDTLDVWHFADVYENAPTLSQGFIEETPTYVDRAITVESSAMDQFILDFYVQNIAYRVMPTYSVPSLVDHN